MEKALIVSTNRSPELFFQQITGQARKIFKEVVAVTETLWQHLILTVDNKGRCCVNP